MAATSPLTVGPRSVERPTDRGATLLGVVGLGPVGRVDGGGAVAPLGAFWFVDWWIGADDRWYHPSRESAVRQWRRGSGPVIETTMRIPSGDARAVAYAVNTGGGSATVVEITNDSPVPVALAVTVRPRPLTDDVPIPGDLVIDQSAPSMLTVTSPDGPSGAVRIDRSPGAVGSSATVDLADAVAAGDEMTSSFPVLGSAANAVLLIPLPHTATVRFVVAPGDDRDISGINPGNLPPPDQVERGWAAMLDAGAGFDFPDEGTTSQMGASRARLLGRPDVPEQSGLDGLAVSYWANRAAELRALADAGHEAPCRVAVAALAADFPTSLPVEGGADAADAVRLVDAVAHAAVLGRVGPESAEADDRLLESMVQLVSLIERSEGRRGRKGLVAASARVGLAKLLLVIGQSDTAAELLVGVERDQPPLLRTLVAFPPSVARVRLDRVAVDEDVVSAAPSGRWGPDDDAGAAARFVMAARRLLIDEDLTPAMVGQGVGALRLLPVFPAAWRGGAVEVHRAPTLFGRLSYAIRWHGFRPALLWEMEPLAGRPVSAIELRCPGLDPDWSTRELSGEALLAGTPDDLPSAPSPGDSFI